MSQIRLIELCYIVRGHGVWSMSHDHSEFCWTRLHPMLNMSIHQHFKTKNKKYMHHSITCTFLIYFCMYDPVIFFPNEFVTTLTNHSWVAAKTIGSRIIIISLYHNSLTNRKTREIKINYRKHGLQWKASWRVIQRNSWFRTDADVELWDLSFFSPNSLGVHYCFCCSDFCQLSWPDKSNVVGCCW